MRILVYYQYFGTPKGSWSTRFYELTRRWVKNGHSVTVITAPYEKTDIGSKGFITKTKIEGIDVIVINSPDSNRDSTLKRALFALRFALVSIWYAITRKCDVVVASSGPITVGIPALIAKWIRRRKMVFEVRDLWPQGAVELKKIKNKVFIKFAFWFEGLCYRNANLVVACSVGMQESVISRYGISGTIVIPNASDIELFNPCHVNMIKPTNGSMMKYFVYTGSLGLIDDFNQCIDAIRYVQRDDIRLVIIGEGAERVNLEARVKEEGLENIVFLGLRPKSDLVKWFSEAWASILTVSGSPAIQNCSPNKMFDSFAAGVPVIQNSTGWIKSLVEDEKCGLNVAQNDPIKFAEAITFIADHPEIRNEYANNALRLAKERFDRNLLAEKYIKSIELL